MRFEWKKTSEIPNGLETKLRACCSQKWLLLQQWDGDKKKRLNSVEVPLSPLLPENVAELKVIFITNEINNAAICIQLRSEGLRQLRGMRIFWRNNPTTNQEVIWWNRLEIRGLKWIWMHFQSIYLHNTCAQTKVIMWKHKSRKIWRLRVLTQHSSTKHRRHLQKSKKQKAAVKREKRRDEEEETETNNNSSYSICTPPEPVLN